MSYEMTLSQQRMRKKELSLVSTALRMRETLPGKEIYDLSQKLRGWAK